MKINPLLKLSELGQSIWLDYLRRDLITGGSLRHLIDDDGVKGMTSNPSIFEKAIAGSELYEEDIRAAARDGRSATEIYETLSQGDVQNAADEFRTVYDKLDGADGFVSLEVNPNLARNTNGTIEEARRLWASLDRPNVFIKVPATAEGLPAIEQLITDGINVNITLLFGLPRYREVAAAYIAGIEKRLAQGKSVKNIASVASFFLSRIDVLVDPLLDKIVSKNGNQADLAKKLQGQVATSSAVMAYQIYKEIFCGEKFKRLADQGAGVQRLLWASTSTKNPNYSDLMYVDPLIGADTINTIPMETLDAYRDHGKPRVRLEQDVVGAKSTLKCLSDLGINLDHVTQQLETEGVEKFNCSFDKLMNVLQQKTHATQEEHSVI